MQIVYWNLKKNIDQPLQKKKEIICATIAEFFTRLRDFRSLSREALSEKSKISLQKITDFESGRLDQTTDIFDLTEAYNKICGGHKEYEIFNAHVFEFFHPQARQAKEELAKCLLIQYGIVMPGIDYKNLESEKGKLLDLKRQ